MSRIIVTQAIYVKLTLFVNTHAYSIVILVLFASGSPIPLTSGGALESGAAGMV